MAQQTEAACLLETGALYKSRVLLTLGGAGPIFAGFKLGAFSLYFGDEPIYHFDLEGRWQRAYVRGIHYLKGLDTKVQAIDRVREGESLVLRRRTLGFAEASDFDSLVRTTALDLLEGLAKGGFERIDPPTGAKAEALGLELLREFLERVASWDAAAWFAHREKYVATYGPLPFLPPDCPNAVVLQLTLGHAGGVTFGLGPAAEHYVRSAEEFETHARAVAALLGRRIEQSRNIFLGGSDVLRRSAPEVQSALETIARVFPIGSPSSSTGESATDSSRLDGVHVFLDDLAPPQPDLESWRRFRRGNLVRVCVGVESGDVGIRSLYRKAWQNEALCAAVADMKTAGLGVSVAVLVDAGGVGHSQAHLGATTELIERLPLGPGDLVELLDGNELRDPERNDPGFTPLSGPSWVEQRTRLKAALQPACKNRGTKVVPYSFEKQGGV